MIEHCIAAFRREEEEKAHTRLYRLYVTDALKAIAENTTHYFIPGVGVTDYGASIRVRYTDLLQPVEAKKDLPEEDPRSAREIVTDMWERIRGKKDQEQ